MRKAWTLTKIYINSVYGIKGYINELKTGKKAPLKIIGVIALIILMIASFAPMLVGFNWVLYSGLKPVNQQGLMITIGVVSATMFTLVFGIVSIIATYFVDKERDIVLSMPIKPWYLLFAKFVVNYISEVLITALILLPAIILYGVKEAMGIAFYVAGLLTILFVPLIPMVICYFILIPIMKFANFLKKKDAIMILSGVLGIGFAVAIQIFSSQMVNFEQNPEAMLEVFTAPNGLVSLMGRVYYPSVLATNGILNISSMTGIINLFLFAGISVLVVVLLINLMSGAYLNSNIGSDEIKQKNKKLSAAQFKSEFKKKSSLSSLTMREIKLMNREPIYLMNGPMIIILMPLIIGVMLFIQKDNMVGLVNEINKISSATYYITLAVAGIGMFLGVTGTPASSAISREGKAFMQIKALPINPKVYMDAKLLHSVIIGALASIMACILGYIIVNLPIINCIIAFVISNLIMLPIFIAGLLIDLKWPKLVWDNPIKAMKQNINVMIVVLGEMFIMLPILAVLIIFVLKNEVVGYLGLTLIPGILSIVLYSLLKRYTQKRFYEIEV
ncbi:MAG: hypothetical protein K0R09_636 [Clostridiales bacterium]|jgi:ABC-2 type transport system permease protein|nr:hypothetical protein [Clostridiales bacterium]